MVTSLWPLRHAAACGARQATRHKSTLSATLSPTLVQRSAEQVQLHPSPARALPRGGGRSRPTSSLASPQAALPPPSLQLQAPPPASPCAALQLATQLVSHLPPDTEPGRALGAWLDFQTSHATGGALTTYQQLMHAVRSDIQALPPAQLLIQTVAERELSWKSWWLPDPCMVTAPPDPLPPGVTEAVEALQQEGAALPMAEFVQGVHAAALLTCQRNGGASTALNVFLNALLPCVQSPKATGPKAQTLRRLADTAWLRLCTALLPPAGAPSSSPQQHGSGGTSPPTAMGGPALLGINTSAAAADDAAATPVVASSWSAPGLPLSTTHTSTAAEEATTVHAALEALSLAHCSRPLVQHPDAVWQLLAHHSAAMTPPQLARTLAAVACAVPPVPAPPPALNTALSALVAAGQAHCSFTELHAAISALSTWEDRGGSRQSSSLAAAAAAAAPPALEWAPVAAPLRTFLCHQTPYERQKATHEWADNGALRVVERLCRDGPGPSPQWATCLAEALLAPGCHLHAAAVPFRPSPADTMHHCLDLKRAYTSLYRLEVPFPSPALRAALSSRMASDMLWAARLAPAWGYEQRDAAADALADLLQLAKQWRCEADDGVAAAACAAATPPPSSHLPQLLTSKQLTEVLATNGHTYVPDPAWRQRWVSAWLAEAQHVVEARPHDLELLCLFYEAGDLPLHLSLQHCMARLVYGPMTGSHQVRSGALASAAAPATPAMQAHAAVAVRLAAAFQLAGDAATAERVLRPVAAIAATRNPALTAPLVAAALDLLSRQPSAVAPRLRAEVVHAFAQSVGSWGATHTSTCRVVDVVTVLFSAVQVEGLDASAAASSKMDVLDLQVFVEFLTPVARLRQLGDRQLCILPSLLLTLLPRKAVGAADVGGGGGAGGGVRGGSSGGGVKGSGGDGGLDAAAMAMGLALQQWLVAAREVVAQRGRRPAGKRLETGLSALFEAFCAELEASL